MRDIYADVPGNVFNGAADQEERQNLAQEIVRAIAATQDKDQGEDPAVQVVESFIGRAQIAQLAGEVANRAAQQPLLRLYDSSDAFAQFAAINFGNPVLQEQMVFLRGLGLVEFLASDLTDASLTSTGTEVAAALAQADRDSFEVFAISGGDVTQPITWGSGSGVL